MILILQKWMIRWRIRWAQWIGQKAPAGLYHINGSETLPAPLSAEEEAALMRRIMDGDESAREPLITHNLRLVVYIARKFETRVANVEDYYI